MFAIPAGQSVIVDNNGTIPYTPEGLKKRQENQAGWPKSDPEAKCYIPGLPRATYMPYPFQIVQGGNDILFIYEYASANRVVHMTNHTEAPVDSWMGWSNGKWDGDALVIEVKGFNDLSWFDRAGNHHSDALLSPNGTPWRPAGTISTTRRGSRTRRRLSGLGRSACRSTAGWSRRPSFSSTSASHSRRSCSTAT